MKKLLFLLSIILFMVIPFEDYPLYAMENNLPQDNLALDDYLEEVNKPLLDTPEFQTYKKEYIRIYTKIMNEQINLDRLIREEVPNVPYEAATDCRTQGILDAFWDAILGKPSRFHLPNSLKLKENNPPKENV